MHPTAALIVWICAVLSAQYLSYTGLGALVLLVFISTPLALGPFLQFAKRGRWLFLSLWLILAYGKPGEAWGDLVWAPTLEGMAEANLQAIRLLTILLCLAWLFTRLGRAGLVSALWGGLRPLDALGIDVERLVVRLSLVLDHLKNPLPAGAWKKMLLIENMPSRAQETLQLSLPPWAWRDSLWVISVNCALFGILLR